MSACRQMAEVTGAESGEKTMYTYFVLIALALIWIGLRDSR
jgi:hypothetical protein